MRIHFIGIGGASMSALAELMSARGHIVSGSDSFSSPVLKKLSVNGIAVTLGHRPENVAGADLVVYTAAVASDNVELLEAQSKGIRTVGRAQFLGELSREYPYTVAISGAHGKTTTSAMTACALLPLNPTVHIGGTLPAIGGNLRIGGNQVFLTEACEYKRAFLELRPYVGVILNIDSDHLDYYKDIEDIESAFTDFARNVKPEGACIANGNDSRASRALTASRAKKYTFAKGSVYAENIAVDTQGCYSFDVYENGLYAVRVALNAPGYHNVDNALAAYVTARIFELPPDIIARSLNSFYGVERRYQRAGELNGAPVISDYAHHPSEIASTLKLTRLIRSGKIVAVFQPHTYTRTHALFSDFVNALSLADEILLAPIYPAREAPIPGVTSDSLAAALAKAGTPASAHLSFSALAKVLTDTIKNTDTLLILGAGDIVDLIDLLVRE